MAWILPETITANGWADAENAIDGDTNTYASHPGSGRNAWGPWLEAHLNAAIDCTEVRIFGNRQNAQVSSMQIEVYYNDAWQLLYDGDAIGNGQYYTYDLEGTYSVSDLRIRFYTTQANRTAYVYSMEMFEEEEAPPAEQFISPSGIASEENFGPHILVPGAVQIQPSGITSAEVFGTPEVIQAGESQMLQPTGILSEEALGAPYVSVGALRIQPTGVFSEESFGSLEIVLGEVVVSPESIPSGEAFGSPALLMGTITIQITSIESEEAFGSPIVQTGTISLTPVGIDSEETFGEAGIALGGISVHPIGIVSEEMFGSTTFLVDALTILPSGISSEESFGLLTVVAPLKISPVGIESEEAFGTLALKRPYVLVLITVSLWESVIGLSLIESTISLDIKENILALEVEGMPKIGSTVRVVGTFKNYDEELTDLDANEAFLKLYDGRGTLLETLACTRESQGVYMYDLVIPSDGEGTLVLEVGGEMSGNPVLQRRKLNRVWV